VTTTVVNVHSARLEAKIDALLDQVSTLTSQIDTKVSSLRDEVTLIHQNHRDEVAQKLTAFDLKIEEKIHAFKSPFTAQFKSKHKAWCTEASQILNDTFTVIKDQAAAWFESTKTWQAALEKARSNIASLESLTEDMDDVS